MSNPAAHFSPESTLARVSERTFDDLKWQRVIDALLRHCATEVGRNYVKQLPIYADVVQVRQQHGLTSEMRRCLQADRFAPFGGISSLEESLGRASRGGIIGAEQLLSIAQTLRGAGNLRGFLDQSVQLTPGVSAISSKMPDLIPLMRVLFATFDASGRIRDDATPELSDLRRRLTTLTTRARQRMEEYVTSTELDLVLQDGYFTIRDSRYVLPVKSSAKPGFAGIIHGTSQTGQTVFVEPEAMIGLNNDIKVTAEEIEREEHRILRDRTDRVFDALPEIEQLIDIVAEIDHIVARAKLSIEMDAHEPELNNKGDIHLIKCRNPVLLLKGNKVVPNDVQIGAQWQILIVTGPNTGGKTVTLSTVGLCTLMAQAGLHIPGSPDSKIAVFPRIFSIYGDPQSIDQDLSTFSGHLQLVSAVIREAGPGALVLMDEIIVGTEPSGGAALAIAVLETFAGRGVRGIVTTHYDRLKTLSLTDSRFQNASVGLDRDNMRPNFRLTIGIAGSSNPIDMARQLGINKTIVDRAEELLGSRDKDIQMILDRLEDERHNLVKEQRRTSATRNELQNKINELEATKLQLHQDGEKIARQYQKETLAEISRIREECQALLNRLKSATTPAELERGLRQLERSTVKVRSAVRQSSGGQPAAKTTVSDIDFHDLAMGVTVYVRSLSQLATIRSKPDNPRRIEVFVGNMRIFTDICDLGKPKTVADKEGAALQRTTSTENAPTAGESPRPADMRAISPVTPLPVGDNIIDLRGMRTEDALEKMLKSFDDALLSLKHAIFVIHGHGTGALKKAIRTELQKNRYVEKWRPGEPDEGGDGVSLVYFKDE
ncbi:MAG: Smr/MutS family protein [Myxococcales bacterium]|nr:Smr/MutS family protein [Myxococcales bacterium]